MTKGNQEEIKKGNFGRTTFLVIIYLLFLYGFQVPGVPFGSVLFAFGVLSIVAPYAYLRRPVRLGRMKASKMVRNYCYWNIFLLLYISVILQLFGSGDGITPLKDYSYMLIMLPVFYITGCCFFRNTKELMKILYIGVIIQAFIIILALFLPTLTIALTLLFPEGAYNTDEQFGGMQYAIAEGYKIGLGVFSSAGSLKMAVGQIGACYYLINSRGGAFGRHLLMYLLIALASSLVARTGFLISALGLLCVFIVKLKQGAKMGPVFLTFFAVFFGYFIITTIFPIRILDSVFQRLIDTAQNGIYETYFRGYSGEIGNNQIPPLSMETLIGLGITYGVSGSGITTITDGGFMRNYSAMGLIVASINYIVIFVFFFKQFKACGSYENRGIILFMLLIFLVGEFKESFIYYVSPMCFFFLIFYLFEKNEMALSYGNTIGSKVHPIV